MAPHVQPPNGMMQLKRIILGYDGFERDEPLDPAVVKLARASGAELHVVNVLPPPPRIGRQMAGLSGEAIMREVTGWRQARLAEMVQAVGQGDNLRVTAEVATGDPWRELTRVATESKASLVAISDEPRGRKQDRGFGPVTHKLLRFCPVPVWACRAGNHGTDRLRVLAAVDASSALDDASAPAASVLELASAMTAATEGDLTVLHAWNMWTEKILRGQGQVPQGDIDQLLRETEQLAEQQLETLVAHHVPEALSPEVMLIKGQPHDAILAALDAQSFDVLVMGTVARSGLAATFVGNTAERLIHRVDCSLVTVKPAAS